MPFLFTYAGAPWLTQKWSRYICANAYGMVSLLGLCGNDDVGQMSAWYVLASMGIYPVSPASNVFIIGSSSLRHCQRDRSGEDDREIVRGDGSQTTDRRTSTSNPPRSTESLLIERG